MGLKNSFYSELIPFCKKYWNRIIFVTFGSVTGSADVDKAELK